MGALQGEPRIVELTERDPPRLVSTLRAIAEVRETLGCHVRLAHFVREYIPREKCPKATRGHTDL